MSQVLSRKQPEPKAKGRGHPVLFGLPESEYYTDFPEGGGYPIGLLARAYRIMEVTDPSKVLHVCSGSITNGVTVDIRCAKQPKVVACASHLPFADNTFQWILADPPYTQDHAENLYQTGKNYISPHVIAQECLRVLRPGGLLGFLHHMVPKIKGGKFLKVYGITQGPGYNIRAWSLIRKK